MSRQVFALRLGVNPWTTRALGAGPQQTQRAGSGAHLTPGWAVGMGSPDRYAALIWLVRKYPDTLVERLEWLSASA